MKQPWIAGLAAAAFLGLAGVAQAQFGSSPGQFGSYSRPQTSPYNRPAVSPYVNLGFGQGSTATNYYGIVRPQQEAYSTFQRLQHEIDTPVSPFGTLTDPSALQTGGQRGSQSLQQAPTTSTTGHAVQYYNYSHYYNFKPRQGGGQ